jgi:hypothetical protein
MTTILKATRPAEFLLALPRFLGYAPSNSIVIQTFRAKRTEATLRVDLPPESGGPSPREVADTLIRLISRVPGVDAVLIVLYLGSTARPVGDDIAAVPPRAELAEKIVTRMASAGLGILDAICVVDDRWASYLDDERGTIAQLAGGPMDAQLIASGLDAELPERNGAPDLGIRPADERAIVTQACRPYIDDRARGDAIQDPRAALELWREALERVPEDLDPGQLAPLLWSLRNKEARDCVLMDLAWGRSGGDEAVRDSRALASGKPVAADSILESFVGDRAHAPSGLRIECAVRLLRECARSAPEPWRLAPLTMLGWLEWARGRGTAAGDYLQLALSIGPGYELARLLLAMVQAGRLPDWVGRAPI